MSVETWARMESAALELGTLDEIDTALLKTLAEKSGRPGDDALSAVGACLIGAVRSGGLRIPIDPGLMANRLENWLRGLTTALAPEPPDFPALAKRWADAFAAARLAGLYSAILGPAGAFLPLIHSDTGLYFQRHHAAEACVGVRLRSLLNAPDPDFGLAALGNKLETKLDNALDTVLERNPLRRGTGPGAPAMRFEGRQKEALAMAVQKRFSIISGGPGTGKTSLAANLLRAWTRLRMEGGRAAPRIRLAAPTGRAAQRLSESLRQNLAGLAPGAPEDDLVRGLECGTLHSLLRYQSGSGDFFHHAHRPLPADLVLVDEVSMVDIFLLARLLDALEPDACLILLGDMDQLPSVEAGSVLADLAPAASAPGHPLEGHLVILDRSHRSQQGILQVTRGINAMDADAALAAMPPPLSLSPDVADAPWPIAYRSGDSVECTEGGCRFLQPAHPKAYRAGWDAWLESWLAFHYLGNALDPARHPGRALATPRRVPYESLLQSLGALSGPEDPALPPLLEDAFAYLDQARILTLTRQSWHGAIAINRRACELLRRRWDARASGDAAAGFSGAPLLILENDSQRGLSNGDVGLQLRLAGRDLAWFRRADGFISHPVAFLPGHEPAFAMTVHKSQGSEYDQALVVLPEAGNRLLAKETLYTALTRARHFAGIYGSPEVFREAIGRKAVRESGLAEYLASRKP